MSVFDGPTDHNQLRGFLSTLQNECLLPAKQYIQESYEAHPTMTCLLALFAATSFTPVVAALALASFTVCLTVAACLFALVAIALCLTVVLSTTLSSSALTVLLGYGFISLRKRNLSRNGLTSRETDTETTADSDIPTPEKRFDSLFHRISQLVSMAGNVRLSPFRHRSRKTRIVALVLLGEAISRLRLPRVLRYSPVYRTFFGTQLFGPRGSKGHPLQFILSLPFFLLRLVPVIGFKLLRLPFQLLGWKTLLVVYLLSVLLSPRVRGTLLRTFGHLSVHVSTGAGAAVHVAWEAAPTAIVRDLPWKAYTTAVLEYSVEIVRIVLVAAVAFLRAQLEKLEGRPQVQTQAEEASYEMVPPAVSVPAGAEEVGSSSATATLRARKAPQAAAEE